jgi:hypothetical protein
MPETTWRLRGADDRLTLVERPQPGCVDLFLDGRTQILWMTGRVPLVLIDAGIAYRDLSDPNGPLAPPAPPSAVEVLAELVAALDAAGYVDLVPPAPATQTRGWVTDIASDVTVVAGAVTAVAVAIEKARAVLARQPVPATH